MQVDPIKSSNFERDELLVEMANLLVKLGKAMSGMPGVSDSVSSVQSKLDAYLAKQRSINSAAKNSLLNDYDVSVDTNFDNNDDNDDDDDDDDDDMNSGDVTNLNGGSVKTSKIKNRGLERLDTAESPAGMDYARNWINTVEQKKGHRRRQSLPYINNNAGIALEEHEDSDDEDTEDVKFQ